MKCAFDDTSHRLGIRDPTVATPDLLKTTLYLGLRIYHRDNLGMGMHQFCLGQNYAATCNILKSCVDQHQVVAGGGGDPTLVYKARLVDPSGVSLLESFPMERSAYMQLCVGLDNLLVQDHPSAHSLYAPNLGLVFPSANNREDTVSIPLTLPMVCKNSLPILCTATDTVYELVSIDLICNQPLCLQKLHICAGAVVRPDAMQLHPDLENLTCNPYLQIRNTRLEAYVYVFADRILVFSQGPPIGGATFVAPCYNHWKSCSYPWTPPKHWTGRR